VVLRYEPDALDLEIADDGPGPVAETAFPGGRGLIGMRQRVQLCGGAFAAGPADGGGFVVRARLPIEAE
jgi:signal transduction histidine kinase